MIKRLLMANRGEIAVRIVRAVGMPVYGLSAALAVSVLFLLEGRDSRDRV